MSDKSKLQEMANKFSAPVFYDASGDFASEVGISSVPSVLVTGLDGKIIGKGYPGMISGLPSEEDNLQYYLNNILAISEFMT